MKFLLLAATPDRIPLLETCLKSVNEFLPDWTLVFVAQGFDEFTLSELRKTYGIANVIVFRSSQGMHNAKLRGLEHIEHIAGPQDYTVASIDDDMEFIKETDLTEAVYFAAEKPVGLVSTGWVRSEKQVAKKLLVEPGFLKQPIVYTGGSLIFNKDTATIIMGIPKAEYLCDNSEWSLAVYMAGLTNYRHRGSVTIHRILKPGGRKAWVGTGSKQLPDPAYLPFRPSKGGGPNDYHIGDSTDLTPAAHARHRKALIKW